VKPHAVKKTFFRTNFGWLWTINNPCDSSLVPLCSLPWESPTPAHCP
jgi:hypothetical protein